MLRVSQILKIKQNTKDRLLRRGSNLIEKILQFQKEAREKKLDLNTL